MQDFLTLPEYFCKHTILTVAAGTTLQYCRWKGLKGAAKANQRERVRMILTDAGMDADYIHECCEAIPRREKKKDDAQFILCFDILDRFKFLTISTFFFSPQGLYRFDCK